MDLHALFNYSVAAPAVRESGGLRPSGQAADRGKTEPGTTASTFVTPQALATFPLAAGIVATFWQAAQALLGPPGKSYWVCFGLAIAIAFINYTVSITDPKLKATSRDRIIGGVFAVVNGVYLFATAIGIKTVLQS
jgi:hypothetical protein